MTETSGHRVGHSEEQAEAIATRAAKTAVLEVFKVLGFDFNKPEDFARWHANNQWLETKRIGEEKHRSERRKQFWGAIITGVVVAAISAMTGFGRILLAYLWGAKP